MMTVGFGDGWIEWPKSADCMGRDGEFAMSRLICGGDWYGAVVAAAVAGTEWLWLRRLGRSGCGGGWGGVVVAAAVAMEVEDLMGIVDDIC